MLTYLRMGASIKSVCDAIGIHETTYQRWVDKSKRFCIETARARARGKLALIAQIVSNQDWRARAWYLERCWPAEFGKVEERRLPEGMGAEKPLINIGAGVVINGRDGKPMTVAEIIKAATFPHKIEEPQPVPVLPDGEEGENNFESNGHSFPRFKT